MKTIFFDWGGVIADDPGDDFLTKLLQDIGAKPDQITEIFRLYMVTFMRGKISEEDYWNGLKDNYDLAIPDNISEKFKMWGGLKANDEILALVAEAKKNGCQTALLTNVIRPTYNVLNDAGYYEKFDQVIASCDEGFAKPDLEIYNIALNKLNVAPEDSIFIDDKQTNLDPAEKMGFKVILAENPTQIIRDVRALIQ